MSYSNSFLTLVAATARLIDVDRLEELVVRLSFIREYNRSLYIIGLGGSAANASHMAADLRNLCSIDARSLDNIAEITARANDEGWDTIFDGFIKNIRAGDALFVLSVGGGTPEVSVPIVRAIDYAHSIDKVHVLGIVGPNGGYTKQHGDCVITIPIGENPTPHTEAFQAVIWHLLTSHPLLQRKETKWK